MKRLFFSLILFSFSQLYAQNVPLRRADSFFGLHFDFHASVNDSLVGKTLTEGMIDSLLTAVKPDFIQVDSKGHPGVTSYPTKVADGTAVKSFSKNPLALLRKVTQKHGVALCITTPACTTMQPSGNIPNGPQSMPQANPVPKKPRYTGLMSMSC